MFKAAKNMIMGLYNRVNSESSNPIAPAVEPGQRHAGYQSIEPETMINLIENQTHGRNYQVTGSLNHEVSNLILNIIHLVIEIRMRVIYSFSCSIYQGSQISQYHKTLPTNGTFMRLSQIEEYIHQCELWHLNFGDEGAWSKACLSAAKITNNPRVYEGHVEFHHIQV